MAVKALFDTNILVYALSNDRKRSERARQLLEGGGILSVQSLNELVFVARKKLGMSWMEVREAIAAVIALCSSLLPVTLETHRRALGIAERYGYRIFDSLIVAAALEASCDVVYSEDMQDGQVIDGLTIRNPFCG